MPMIMLNIPELLSELKSVDFRYLPAEDLLECYTQINLSKLLLEEAPDNLIKGKEDLIKQCESFLKTITTVLKNREQEHQILIDIASENEDMYYEYLYRLPLDKLVLFYEEARKLTETDPEMEDVLNQIGDIMSQKISGFGGRPN